VCDLCFFGLALCFLERGCGCSTAGRTYTPATESATITVLSDHDDVRVCERSVHRGRPVAVDDDRRPDQTIQK
jgi:hypothetical protein